MKRYQSALFALSLWAGLGSFAIIDDAEAARLGGGRGMGVMRSIGGTGSIGGAGGIGAPGNLPRRQVSPTPQQALQPDPGRPSAAALQEGTTQAGGWFAPLASLTAGLGLGWLLAQGGMGPMLLGLLVMAAAIALIMRMAPHEAKGPLLAAPLQYAGLGNETVAAPPPSQLPAGDAWRGNAEAATPLIPGDFDKAGFLAEAGRHFLRLQAACGQADLATLRGMTTDVLYARLAGEALRPAPARHGDVILLETSLLEVTGERDGGQQRASVRFTGQVSARPAMPAVPFAELWQLTRPAPGTAGWLVAGIEEIG